MKKKAIALLLSAMMAVVAVGCGDNKENTAEGTEVAESTETAGSAAGFEVIAASSAFDLKGSDYAKVCDYSAMDLTITGDYDVDDEDVENYFAQVFASYGPFYVADPEKTTIGEGDIVNVDYVGKLDGEAFTGGTAEDQNIDVYGNCAAGGYTGYIDGFTEGLKGASVGDVLDCDVTFPEDYGNTDLAGKAVVFTFTVNSIQREMTVADVDDAFVKENFQVETVAEMKEQVKTYLQSVADYSKESDTYMAAQDYLLEGSTVEVPEDFVKARTEDYKRQFITINCGGDESQLESYLSTYYGKTVEEAEADWTTSMEKSVRLELIMDAIVEEMGLTLNEEEFDSYMSSMASGSGYDSVEAMCETYGFGDSAYGEVYLKDLYLFDQALEKMLENATITIAPAETAGAAETTEAVETTEAE